MRRIIGKLSLAMALVAMTAALAVPTLAFADDCVAHVEHPDGNVTEHMSLQDAVNAAAAAGDPETEWEDMAYIYLQKDVDLGSAGLLVPEASDADLYLYMNGHELTSSNSQYTVMIEEGTYLQITDGLIVNTSPSGRSVVFNCGQLALGELIFEDNSQTSVALVAREGVDCAVFNAPRAFANFMYSVVKGGDYAVINHGELWVEGASITGELVTDDLVDGDEYTPSLTVFSGVIDGGLICGEACEGADVQVCGGRFSEDPASYVSELGEYYTIFGPVDGYYVVSDIQERFYENCLKDEDCHLAWYKDANPKAWYHDGLEWANGMGVITGYTSPDSFIAEEIGPLDNVTREQFAVMMYRYANMRNFDMSMGDLMPLDFKDAGKVSSWAEQSVKWAYGIGVLRGYGDGTVLGPQDEITREQLAVMLYRFAEYAGMDTSVGEDTNILSYKDSSKIGNFAFESLQWAVGSGIIGGYTENGEPTGYLGPKDSALRAQVGTMLMRLYYL
ncbi:MAG: S-layer homology domain-containing protein [Eggerthellaceae bacterium]|nr:S-layer homology domain-containing protein [Eggerthellaceae bacterium]